MIRYFEQNYRSLESRLRNSYLVVPILNSAISNRIFQNFRSLDRNSTRYFEFLKIEKKKVATFRKNMLQIRDLRSFYHDIQKREGDSPQQAKTTVEECILIETATRYSIKFLFY